MENQVAVFGVLDPDIQYKIGRLNYGWWTNNVGYETTIRIADPADSVKQAMMRCQEVDVCKNATSKVLLAQMPVFNATQLLTSLDIPFDLTIAQTDPANKTGSTQLI
jgi:hypothetical protein